MSIALSCLSLILSIYVLIELAMFYKHVHATFATQEALKEQLHNITSSLRAQTEVDAKIVEGLARAAETLNDYASLLRKLTRI